MAYSSWLPVWNSWTSGSIITTTTAAPTYIPLACGDPAPIKAAKKSALDWLDAAIEEVCALARDVSVSS